jgi:hypothetical protein
MVKRALFSRSRAAQPSEPPSQLNNDRERHVKARLQTPRCTVISNSSKPPVGLLFMRIAHVCPGKHATNWQRDPYSIERSPV